MKKIFKRICTGVLTLATVLTALPVSQVFASDNQYYADAPDNAGRGVQIENNGNVQASFIESIMQVEGENAYCIDINTAFEAGYKTRYDATSKMTADQVSDVALSLEYAKQYTRSHGGRSNKQAYLLEQCTLWRVLNGYLGWNSNNVRADYIEIPEAIQSEVYAQATAFAKEDRIRYNSYSYVYIGSGQDLGQFWTELAVSNAKMQKTSENTSITDGNYNYSIAGTTFYLTAWVDGGVMKRLDLTINDMAGIIDIPKLTEKSINEECISVFRTFKSYRSGELIKHEEKLGMGNISYICSLKSEVYFCIYEKDYEQYVKYGIPIDDTLIKNRFEIRLKNDRAYYAVEDLLTYQDAESIAFAIINRYIRCITGIIQ